MDKKILDLKYKSIHETSEDDWGIGTCKKCGDESEEWVHGVKKNNTTRNIYTYPDMKPRKRFECSKCVEDAHIKSLTKRIRSTKIFVKNCDSCNEVYVGKQKKGAFCSKKCRVGHFVSLRLKKYNLKCEYCSNTFVHNQVRKYCSDTCKVKSVAAIVTKKPCKTCSVEFEGTPKQKYCSDKCSPWTKGYIDPKRWRNCVECDTKVLSPKKRCDVHPKKKPKKERKTYSKVCPTCDKKFSTIYNYKVYCKARHIPSSMEAKKLRKQTERKSK